MPITSSAKKALRSSKRKHVYNIRRKKDVKDAMKELRNLVIAGKKKEAEALLPKVFQALDKAAKKNTIKKENASRKKSRLVAAIKKMS
jgi:small subunit ribosomal protein S20